MTDKSFLVAEQLQQPYAPCSSSPKAERLLCRERLERQRLRLPAGDLFREQLSRDLCELQPKPAPGAHVVSARSAALTLSLRFSARTDSADASKRQRGHSPVPAAGRSGTLPEQLQRTLWEAKQQTERDSLAAHAVQMLCGLTILSFCLVYAAGLLLVGRLGLLPTIDPLVRLVGRLVASSAALQALADTLSKRHSFVVRIKCIARSILSPIQSTCQRADVQKYTAVLYFFHVHYGKLRAIAFFAIRVACSSDISRNAFL